jgi:hypothetical protein
MNVVIEKIGETSGKERFVLVNIKSGKVVTKNDVSEPTMRSYLKRIGETETLIDEAFEKARKRFNNSHAESADHDDLEDIFSEVTLDEEGGSDIH